VVTPDLGAFTAVGGCRQDHDLERARPIRSDHYCTIRVTTPVLVAW